MRSDLPIQALLICLAISTTTQDFPAIYGPVVTELGAYPVFIHPSTDGMVLFLSF